MNSYSRIISQLGVLRFLDIWIAAKLLPIWIYKKNFSSTLGYFENEKETRFSGVNPQTICNCIMLVTKKPWFMRDRRCLRQGLLTMKFLKNSGVNPKLLFGVDTNSINKMSLTAHCWVELDNIPVMNDILDNMIIIHSISASNMKA